MSVLLMIIGLILFVSLVVAHEFGHYIVARRNKVEVEEFGIGFPPKAWSKKLKSGMLFSVNWLPLGGFVKLKGEHDADTQKGSYGRASLWGKIKIMLAGVAANLLIAIVLFSFLALIGIPKIIENQYTIQNDTKIVQNSVLIGQIAEKSPAEKAGLIQRDKLLSVSNTQGKKIQINSAQDLPDATRKFAGQKVNIEYQRKGVNKVTSTQLRSEKEVEESKNSDQPVGYLGVVPTEFTIQRSTWSAPIVGIGLSKQITQLTLSALGKAIVGIFQGNAKQASEQVAGPVGVFVLIRDGSELGIRFILMIVAVISLTLAIMNILPIPALDGGRLFVTLLYRAIRKKLTPKAEELIHGVGFASLMVLFILITVVDVKRFF